MLFRSLSYEEHALGKGEDARAVAYIQIADDENKSFFGVGKAPKIAGASLKALVSALNRSALYAPPDTKKKPRKSGK